MLIEELTHDELDRRLRERGVHLDTGAWTIHLRLRVPDLARDIAEMYGAYPVAEPETIADASLFMQRKRSWPFLNRARVNVCIDEQRDFDAVSGHAVYATFESALNWSIALSDVAPLLMHAAVLERDGSALLLPGPSGTGKSTLCAALACSGWRLFSDEVAIFRPDDLALAPNPRPVSLKNGAIDTIRRSFPSAHISRTIVGTAKGDIAYMRSPRAAIERSHEPALAGTIVQPIYHAGAATSVRRLASIEAFRLLTDNAVNYTSMLQLGFDAITRMVDRCRCYALVYSRLDEAMDTVAALHRGDQPN
ncbi:MAG TPA: HprK-related kinase A [Casimicrobiaceae bacterium]|nr:HprK-related kinase A [Casimicrobiaceae bacterium]